jgi:hypothetical protein
VIFLHDFPFHRSARISDDERLWFGYSPIAKHHVAVAHETALIVEGDGDGASVFTKPGEAADAMPATTAANRHAISKTLGRPRITREASASLRWMQ